MTAAFVLGINMFIAAIFAVAFAVVAATNPLCRGARWMAMGYAAGILYVVLEFALHWRVDPFPVNVLLYFVYLLSLTLCLIGVARHYGVAAPHRAMAATAGLAVVLAPALFTMAYASPVRTFLYQLPYVAMQGLFLLVFLRSGRRQALDLLLLALQGLACTVYMIRPLLALAVGNADRPQNYMTTLYAAISQSLGSVVLISLALVILLVMMRDSTAEMTSRSETDMLSGVLNRRGFHEHGERALAKAAAAGQAATLIAADLDHFKRINDSFGHAAGDAVIAHFARLLRDGADGTALVGRMGGEEFALLLIGADLARGRVLAETVRQRFRCDRAPDLGVEGPLSASFGVAQQGAGESLAQLEERADAALYRAKEEGRDQVRLAFGALLPHGSAQVPAASPTTRPALAGG